MGSTSQASDERKIYGVGELTRDIKSILEDTFGTVWVEGEISNLHLHSSGHLYFTLKDDRAQIGAAMFRSQRSRLTFEPQDGMQVRVYGQVSVYEPRGQYQLIARKIEEAGKGSLQEAFEKLKKKLADEGLFDPERKKPIPLLPQRIGVVTSPTGAAIRDILNVISRRFPNLHVLIAPAKVQGEGSAEAVAAGIQLLDRHGHVDVMIVGRGGGSLEDLWCFNEETVARAIAAADTPIISAVGHEIDFTISDFVADLRAPTPSAAAELVVGRKEEFEQGLRRAQRQLLQALESRRLELKNRLTAAARSYVFREPQNLVRQYAERIRGLRTKMLHEGRALLNRGQQRTDESGMRLTHRMDVARTTSAQELRRLESQLRALSPLAVLERGFSITHRANGDVVRAAEQVKRGEALQTRVAHGTIESEVTKADANEKDGKHG